MPRDLAPETMTLSRRRALRLAGGAALAILARARWRPRRAAGQPQGRGQPVRRPLRLGQRCSDRRPRLRATASCSPNNATLYAANLSWASVTPKRGTPDPAREDPNVAFARAHGLKLTGAHLLWHESTPNWFSDLSSAGEAQQAIADHIHAMARHYAGEVYSWNVVNEVDEPSGRARRRAAPFAAPGQARAVLHRIRVPRGAPGQPRRPAGLQRLWRRDGQPGPRGTPAHDASASRVSAQQKRAHRRGRPAVALETERFEVRRGDLSRLPERNRQHGAEDPHHRAGRARSEDAFGPARSATRRWPTCTADI